MSRRSPVEISKDDAAILRWFKTFPKGATKEQFLEKFGDLPVAQYLTATLRTLVQQRKVRKKGKTRAMVYTAK